jgi:hypothetical protein
MRTTTRTAAAALAAVVTFGAGAPVATAAGHADNDRPAHVKVAKGDHGKKADQALRQLLRDIAKTDAKLVKVVRETRTARIGEHAVAVRANVDTDRAALTDLAAAVQAADNTRDLREVRKELKDVRWQNYNKVINDLRHAVKLAAEIAEARAAAEGDLEAPVAELDAAQAAVEAAVAKALLITASSDKSELRAVKAELQAAHEALDSLDDSDDADDTDDTEDTEDEDELDDELEDEPAEEDPIV